MNLIFVFKKFIALIVASVMLLGAGVFRTEPHTVLNEDECRLCVAVLSDMHIEGNNMETYNNCSKMLKDIANNSFGNDAAVFLGDNTMNGQNIESMFFYGALVKTPIADNMIVTVGNHDVGNGEGDYDKLFNRFRNFNNEFLDTGVPSTPYYYKVIDGYYFIVLGPEELCVHEFPCSDAQYEFLEETLALASQSGKPIFVCSHHPYDYVDDEDRMVEILTKYDNVFCLSGHTHMPLCDWSFSDYDGVRDINLPRCTDNGDMIQLEIYDDEVVFRARNCLEGTWDEELEYHYELTK